MFKKKFTTFCFVLCGFAVYLGLQQLIELKTRGFCLQKIFSRDLFINPEWDIGPLKEKEQTDVLHALDQPYTFLGAGSECFVFLSKDGKTVIKFFKLNLFRPIYFLRGQFTEDHREKAGTLSSLSKKFSHFPHSLEHVANRALGMREFRIGRTFKSLKIAYDSLKEEVGLLYLHLNPTSCFHKTLILYDPNGIAHEIDIDSTRFYLQRHATSLKSHLLTLKKYQDHRRAQKSLTSLCDLILDRCRKGFADRDPYSKNFGFIDDQAIELDAGSFAFCPQMKDPHFYKQELFYIALQLNHWIQKNYPQLLGHLHAKVHKEVASDAHSS